MASETTRHEALSLSNARGSHEPDFDFLAQPPGYRRNPLPFKWFFRFCIAAVLVLLLILVIVDLNSNNGGSHGLDYRDVACLTPLGGGVANYGTHVGGAVDDREGCHDVRNAYLSENGQYWEDTETAIQGGDVVFLEKGNYSQMVILDIDETALSNIPINTIEDVTPREREEWEMLGEAPVIPATQEFYTRLRENGFSVAFITGRRERHRPSTEHNLDYIGYGKKCRKNPAPDGKLCYHALILRENDDHRDAIVYKSAERKKLMEEGFTIVASVGDQWSDLLGTDRPPVLVKMPNPMYYIP